MKKITQELKAGFGYLCVWENKRFNTFKVTIIIFLGIRNVNLLFKKDFKSVKLLNKKQFTLYFRAHPKSGHGEKRQRSKFMR